MRKDMHEVLIERPRGGFKVRSMRQRMDRFGDAPGTIGIRRLRELTDTKHKYLRDHLAPLKRYLAKQVGRPWNHVYSDICASQDRRNFLKQHVHEHLENFVLIHVVVAGDGEFFPADSWDYGWRPGEYWRQPFYVDPNTGLLKSSRALWQKLARQSGKGSDGSGDQDRDAVVVILDADYWYTKHELRKLKGIWYEIRYRRDPEAPEDRLVFDLVGRKRVWAGEPHAYRKTQLSSAALKRYGLTND